MPDRIAQIKKDYEKRKNRLASQFAGNQKLKDLWGDDADDESLEDVCNICHL